MPFSMRMEGDILNIAFSGEVTNADLVALMAAAKAMDAQTTTLPHRLVDFTAATHMAVDLSGVQAFARARREITFPNSIKSAFVARNPVHFGFARMYQNLLDHPQIILAIFPTMSDALAWIAEPGLELPDHTWEPSQST